MNSRALAYPLIALSACAFVGEAKASAVDMFGYGSPMIGRGGGIALIDDSAAILINPAALTRLTGDHSEALGFSAIRMRLDDLPDVWWDTNRDGLIDDSDAPLSIGPREDSADNVQLSSVHRVGDRFGFGITLAWPVQRLMRIETFEPSIPTYFLYDNRFHRFDAAVGFGWEQIKGLSIGGSVRMLTRASLDVIGTLDLGTTGADEATEAIGELLTDATFDLHSISIVMQPAYSPIAAVQWDVGEHIAELDGMQVALTWRGSSGLPVDINVDLQANVNIEDVGELDPIVLGLVTHLGLSVFDHYVPQQIQLGVAYAASDRLNTFVDIRRTYWAAMLQSVAHVVEASLEVPLVDLGDTVIGDGNIIDGVALSNTWSWRLGGEWRALEHDLENDMEKMLIDVRGGIGVDSSPLRTVDPAVPLLDADRFIVAGGVGFTHQDPFGFVGPVHYDLHAQLHTLASSSLTRQNPQDATAGYPVDGSDTLPIGGAVWTLGGLWSFEY